MILFEKGLEIKDEQVVVIAQHARMIGVVVADDKAYVEEEVRSYLQARTSRALLDTRDLEAKEEVKEFVKPGDVVIKGEAIGEAGEVELKP